MPLIWDATLMFTAKYCFIVTERIETTELKASNSPSGDVAVNLVPRTQ